MKLTLEERIAHGGNEPLRWMMDNIFIRTDPAGNIKVDKERVPSVSTARWRRLWRSTGQSNTAADMGLTTDIVSSNSNTSTSVVQYDVNITAEGDTPVSNETAELVSADNLAVRQSDNRATVHGRMLLTGLAYCGNCGKKLVGHYKYPSHEKGKPIDERDKAGG
jgi:hypothetical protein